MPPLPRVTLVAVAAASAAALLLAGCTGSSGGESAAPSTTAPSTASAPTTSPSTTTGATGGDARPQVAGTVTTGLDSPWGLAFLPAGYAPDGIALVSERDSGDLVLVAADGTKTGVGRVPGVVHNGEGGLLGLAVAKDFAATHWLYAYLTTASDNRVVRMKFENEHLGAPQVVVSGLRNASFHDGGRIAFGPDGFLYIGVGDAGDRPLAQDKSSRNGKILRVTATGAPAPGNPFPGSPVYSYGHRNVQGLAWDESGQLWASEFGQNTWDELNKIEAGGNYGWPLVEGRSDDPRFVDPQAQWPTDEASPSGIAIVDGTVLMAALRGQRLWAIPIEGGTAGTPRDYLNGEHGRLRTVSLAPDGSVWLITSNTDGRGDPQSGDDRILRLTT